MAILRTYSATIAETTYTEAAVVRLRFDETSGSRAFDSIDDVDGRYEGGVGLDAGGSIGDGAASLDGTDGRVVLATGFDLSVTPTIAVFGDSLTANNTVDPAERYVPELDAALAGEGLDAEVVNFSVSGETIQDALGRIGEVIDAAPDLVIVALGTNDAEEQRPLAEVDADLRSLVSQLQAGGSEVLLTGTFGYFPETGGGYTEIADRDAFEALFAQIATDLGVEILDADGSDKFLGGQRIEGGGGTTIEGGVLGDDALHIDGDIHPNAAGIDQIVARTLGQTLEAVAGTSTAAALELADGSIEMWVTPDQIGGKQVLFARNGAGAQAGDIEAQLDGDQVRISMQDATGTYRVDSAENPGSGFAAVAGTPLHVVLTFGAEGMRLFLNGELIAENAFTGGLTDNGIDLSIGISSEGTDAFAGVIDEFAVYDQALGDAHVQALFASGSQGGLLVGTDGADQLIGGVDDELFGGEAGADLILAGGGDDILDGGRGGDELRGEGGDDALFGRRGIDSLYGNRGADDLSGNAGRDALYGGGGSDLLLGGRGKDTLMGKAGNDLLDGGPGQDTLIGGGGQDTFVLGDLGGAPDRILDFKAGALGDVLDLREIVSLQPDQDPADAIRLTESGGDTRLEVAAGDSGGFVAAADLIGSTGLDLGQLIADGNLVTA